MEATVEALAQQGDQGLPQNMFAPFTLVRRAAGKLARETAPTVHWAHVDTGSMVNLVYSGVVELFGELQQYQHPFCHVVYGIGGGVQRIIGKLVGVPLSIGSD